MTGLRPALFARVGDLPALRYDLPLVLLDGEEVPARSLSAIVDDLLREVAPRGPRGERMRRSVLRLESEIRRRLARGDGGRLAELWDRAAKRICEDSDRAAQDLATARTALRADGEVVDRGAASRVAMQAWQAAQRRQARAARARIDELITRLEDLLRADLLRSPAGRRPGVLRAALAGPFAELFDLDEMSSLLGTAKGWAGLSDAARERIAAALRILREETCFRADPAAFAFRSVYSALNAYRARVPAMTALIEAMATAERVGGGDARPAGARGALTPGAFPDTFVGLRTGGDVATCAHALEALLSGVPLKILVEVDDLLDPAARLGVVAMGLGEVFVVQTTIAGLAGAVTDIGRAMDFRGPALVSVFTGELDGGLPPYLVAAAAADARAFPAFTYDPSAGPGWADRFALGEHAQPERPYPVHPLEYADDALQRVTLDIPFTFADLALCDDRLTHHFTLVPRDRWSDLAGATVVHAIDAENGLHRLIVDDELRARGERHAAEWQRLRELDSLKRPAATLIETPAPPVAVVAAPPVADAAAAEPPATPDEPYIETPRCSTCNECTKLNPRMFKYNDNKQAYIADLTAGSYRELVEAAESCQVAIIHPGKPRDPNEPGLAELVERAAAFA